MSVAQALRRGDDAALVDGEYLLTSRDFKKIAGLLREQSGIHLSEQKAALVYSRLTSRLRKLKLRSFTDYCTMLASPQGLQERSELVAALTTNVTSFFREPHHFDHLRTHVIEPMIGRVRAGGRMRLWSSACSTGEEAYSLALTLLAVMPDASQYDVKILATDIDQVVLETARSGVYATDSIESIPKPLCEKWTAPAEAPGTRRLRDEVKRLIAFRQLNLVGEWPMRGVFDAIFCRNVAIYFEAATQRAVWRRFHEYLGPEGRLYVGHSERVDSPGYLNDGVTTYRRAPS